MLKQLDSDTFSISKDYLMQLLLDSKKLSALVNHFDSMYDGAIEESVVELEYAEGASIKDLAEAEIILRTRK